MRIFVHQPNEFFSVSGFCELTALRLHPFAKNFHRRDSIRELFSPVANRKVNKIILSREASNLEAARVRNLLSA